MNDVSGKIVAIKTEVREQNWETMISECQQSGMSVKEWCHLNGVNSSTYYSRLRKLREKVCNEIIPIEAPMAETISEIKITSGEIAISLASNVSQETLTKILMALRSC
jgi:transposase-like protein